MTILSNVITSRGVLQDYYNKLMPAGYYARILQNGSSQKKLASAIERLPGVLASVPTYSEYLETMPGEVLNAIRENYGSRVAKYVELLDSIVEKLHVYAGRKPEAVAGMVEEAVEAGRKVLYEE